MPVDMDLHIHSKYSYDSFLTPKTIVKLAKKRGLSVIAVTDHETIKGGLATVRAALPEPDVLAIPGIEVKTDRGDVIGLFVTEEIQSRGFLSVVEAIRAQDGLVVLPHPYGRNITGIKQKARYVDLIETLNGRTPNFRNTLAQRLAKELKKPVLASSDAHTAFELGRIRTRFNRIPNDQDELRNALLQAKRDVIGREAPFVVHAFSFTTQIFKRFFWAIRGSPLDAEVRLIA